MLWLRVSKTLGSHVKTWITQWKFAKNENGSRISLIGPGGVVWKTRLQKSYATVPLKCKNNENNERRPNFPAD